MSDDKPRSDAYRSGQVYAVLEMLRKIGSVPGPKFSDEAWRRNASRRPRSKLTEPFWLLGKYYSLARSRDAAAADAILRSLPGLMPSKTEFPGDSKDAEQAEFLQGRLDQLESITKETGVR